MKVIQPGQIDEQPPDWWVGKQLTCSVCRCVFQLERDDNATTYAERRIGGRRGVTVVCPTPNCGATVTHQENVLTIQTGNSSIVQPWPNPTSRRIEPTTMDTAGTIRGAGDVTVS